MFLKVNSGCLFGSVQVLINQLRLRLLMPMFHMSLSKDPTFGRFSHAANNTSTDAKVDFADKKEHV